MEYLTKNQEKAISELHSKKGRSEQNLFIIEGIKPLEELVNSSIKLEKLIVDQDKVSLPQISALLAHFCKTPILSAKNFNRISTLEAPEGIMAVCQLPKRETLPQFISNKSNLLAIYEINDPGNLGTIIRTARWFGIEGIILIGNCTDEYAPKTVRSSMGAILKMPVCRIDDLTNGINDLSGFYKIGSFVHDKHHFVRAGQNKKILFLGSEAHGLPSAYQPMMNSNYLIESNSGFESLNIAVAAGIMLHQIFG